MSDRIEHVEKCDYCDTVLVYEMPSGQKLRFIAHDDEFCKQEMKALISSLKIAHKQSQDSLLRRCVDEIGCLMKNLWEHTNNCEKCGDCEQIESLIERYTHGSTSNISSKQITIIP